MPSADTGSMTDRYIALDHAARHANRWLDSLATRPVPARASVTDVLEALGTELPAGPTQAGEVIDLLATACDAGLTAMPSGRFYGFVIGGAHPAGLAADWLVSAWDQNAVLRAVSPAHAAVEDVTSAWLLDLLGLPETSGVGFVTGATMSNFTCLAAARDAVLRRVGWDVAEHGLSGSPRVRVLVGAQRHDTVDLALRYLGLGAPEPVRADDQGRIDPDALSDALDQIPAGSPIIVVIAAIDGGSVENDVVFSQVSASFGPDERTAEVSSRLMADGTAWMTGSRWHDKAVLRISVSNWSTTDEDVARSLAALRRAATED
jgi:glutamate/tyrosine decarboxylase-like PLP-dependent enzyme